jgi:hypothetical protein
MLDTLSKFNKEKIKIRCVLSYGEVEYKNEIIDKGQRLFGNDNFEYFEHLMPLEEYYSRLSEVDILIMNQNRQQGKGSILAALWFGAKIFIKKTVPTNKSFSEKFIIHDTETIPEMSFYEFIHKSNTENKNAREIIKELNRQVPNNWLRMLS